MKKTLSKIYLVAFSAFCISYVLSTAIAIAQETQVERATIRSNITTDIADNMAQEITAEDVRTQLLNILDSTFLATDTGMETNFIPVFDGTRLNASSIEEQTLSVDISKPANFVDQEGVNVGQWAVDNGGSNILITNSATDQMFYPISSELQTNGSALPRYFEFGEVVSTPSPADKSETFTGSTIQAMITNANTGRAESYTYDSVTAQTDCNFIVRLNSHTDDAPIFDYKRSTGGEGFDLLTGENSLDLPVPLFFLQNQELYVTIGNCTGGDVSLRGQTLSGETVPYIATSGRLATVKKLPL